MSDLRNSVREQLRGLAGAIASVPAKMRRQAGYMSSGVRVARGTFIEKGTSIGRRTRINAPSYIGQCSIGSYCAIGGRLIIRSANHHIRFLNMQGHAQRQIIGSAVGVEDTGKSGVTIGHGVWIGDSVIVLPGVDIGNGAVIGAGSVVTKSVPAYAVAVGNPARVIKYRFPPDALMAVEQLPWWTWSDAKLRENRWLFELDLWAPLSMEALQRIKALTEDKTP